MNPLNSVKGSIATGFIVAALITIVLAQLEMTHGGVLNIAILVRWLHVVSGVMWIGLLYYFNVVQVPGLAAAASDTGGPGGAGISKYIAPRALLWFRWAAVATWVTGAFYLVYGYGDWTAIHRAFSLTDKQFISIGIGAWLGTIMAFNVWVFIWPNQKKVLGIVPATDEEKAKARKVALMASRINFVLSIPMLMCMSGQSHTLPF